MASNLVAEVAEVLSPALVSRIASALGLNQTSTQKAIVAAIPALLASLISYVSTPQGATKLNEVVRKQEPGMLSSLASAIGEPGQKALIDQGSSVLTSLLGGKTLSALSGALGQYAGTGKAARKICWASLGRWSLVFSEGSSATKVSMPMHGCSPTSWRRKCMMKFGP